jgi:DNA repair protein RadD
MHVRTKPNSNPVVVIPTAGGKSLIMAEVMGQWKTEYAPFRVLQLCHRAELIRQNAEELSNQFPWINYGIYSASLNRKDEDEDIIFAGIDSIFKKAGYFKPWDAIIVDECHRISPRANTKFNKFIKECKEINPKLIVMGVSATPFRMAGPVCHKDHILNEIIYEANVADLIDAGYICKVRTKPRHTGEPDLTNVKKARGDYVINQLAAVTDIPSVVKDAVGDFVKVCNEEKRNSIIVFAINVEHAKHVSQELRKFGIDAPVITGKTSKKERARILKAFDDGHYRYLINIACFTEGLNIKRIDAVIVLRPTDSRGLWIQIVGRGFRLHPSKEDFLVLDYGGNLQRHPPIDLLEAGEVKLYECKHCEDVFSRAVGICPNCQTPIPKIEVEKMEAMEREIKLHEAQASNRSILSSEPETYDVNSVTVNRHVKLDKPDSIRVSYRCGISTFCEWIALDHDGFASRKARGWWAQRFGAEEAQNITVDSALEDMFLGNRINDITKEITVRRKGKYTEVIDHIIDNIK